MDIAERRVIEVLADHSKFEHEHDSDIQSGSS